MSTYLRLCWTWNSTCILVVALERLLNTRHRGERHLFIAMYSSSAGGTSRRSTTQRWGFIQPVDFNVLQAGSLRVPL